MCMLFHKIFNALESARLNCIGTTYIACYHHTVVQKSLVYFFLYSEIKFCACHKPYTIFLSLVVRGPELTHLKIGAGHRLDTKSSGVFGMFCFEKDKNIASS